MSALTQEELRNLYEQDLVKQRESDGFFEVPDFDGWLKLREQEAVAQAKLDAEKAAADAVGRLVMPSIKVGYTKTEAAEERKKRQDAVKASVTWHDADEQVTVIRAPSLVESLIYGNGASSVLSAKPKHGKTTMLLDMIEAILKRINFLKRETTPTSILYVTEQYQGSFVQELGNSGLLVKSEYPERMRYLTAEDWYKLTWDQIVELTVEEAVRLKAGMVVFDTLSRIARLESENDASEMQAAVDVTAALAKEKVSTMFVQHDRKAEGTIFDSGRGTNALMGAVDYGLRITLPPVGKQPKNHRMLEYVGRYPGPNEPLIITRDTADDQSRYAYVGTDMATRFVDAQNAILAIFKPDNEWLSEDEIRGSVEDASRSTVKRAVKKLYDDGLLEQRETDIGKGRTKRKEYREAELKGQANVVPTDKEKS